MIKVLVGIGILVLLLFAGALAAPFFIPVEHYRGLIEAQVAKSTGRTFQIKGPMKLSLLPRVKIELNDVSLGNAPGGTAAEFASIRRLDLGVALWPLLHKRVEADRLILVEPSIALEVDKAGKPNWQFAKHAESAPKETTDAAGRDVAFHFSGLELHDGRLSYADLRSKAVYRVDKVNLSLDFSDLDAPIKAKGNLLYRDRRVDVVLEADKPAALIDGGTSPVEVKLTSEPAKLHFAGTAQGGKAPRADGDLKADVPSVEALVTWLAPRDPEGALPVRAVALTAHVTAGADKARLAGLVFNADTLDARGDLELAWSGPRPRLAGSLATGIIDLTPYMPAAGGAGSGGGAASGGDAGWSDKPIDLGPLRKVDADLKLKAAGIKGPKFVIGESSLTVALANGTLDAAVPNAGLFGGAVDARIHVESAATVPVFGIEAHVRDVQAQPLLAAFANYNRLKGTMRGSAALRARGASQKLMMQSLNGTMQGGVFNGAIEGIDLPSLLQKANTVFLGRGGDASQQTTFTEISASFAVRNGTAHTEDMKMFTPLVRLTGKGDIIFPEKRVAMRVEPVVLGGLKDSLGVGKVAGLLSVPFLVSGPWSRPSLRPDVAGVLSGGALKERLHDRLGLGKDKDGTGKKDSGPLGGIKHFFGR